MVLSTTVYTVSIFLVDLSLASLILLISGTFQVVGIEMNASAVADAQLNADLNGIKNCRFISGKVCTYISCYGQV